MPAEVQQPLAVLFTLPGGVAYHGRLHDLANSSLTADLAAGLVAATHPHGPIRTLSVARQYVTTMRRFARDLCDQGFTGGLADLTPAALVQYWLTCDHHRERRIRVVLSAFQDMAGGLAPGICRHLAGRRINKIAKSRANLPYSDGEWQRLADACTEVIATAHRAHRQAVEAAARGAAPSEYGVTRDNLAWLLQHTGPLAPSTVLDRIGAAASHVDRAEIMAVHRALFPAAEMALAYNTLFAMRTGIVPDGIDALTIGNITRTSANTVLLSYLKGRTGGEALNLPRDAVRLLDRWLTHSALLREHAEALAGQLWIHTGGDSWGRGMGRIFAKPRTQSHRRAWVHSTGVRTDDGQPLSLHGGRIRATYHHRRDRTAWTGRTTIDPNHSARVEGDHYLTSHTPAQLDAIEGIIEQAQGDIRRKAEPPVVVTSEDAAAFTAAFPRLVEDAGLEYFSQQADRMTTVQFLRIFGPYGTRLDDDVLPRFGASAINAATRQVATSAYLPLHLEELPL